MNESRDFAKITCVRSRDFSGPDQGSMTMASLLISMEKFSGWPCNSPWHGRRYETNKEVQ